MRGMLPLALSLILTACAQATISSPGKSDDAIRADMNSCDAGSLTLHSRPVINCLSTHGDTITYADGSIPPYTTGNPYDIPLTAAPSARAKSCSEHCLGKMAGSCSKQCAECKCHCATPVNKYLRQLRLCCPPRRNRNMQAVLNPLPFSPMPLIRVQSAFEQLKAIDEGYSGHYRDRWSQFSKSRPERST